MAITGTGMQTGQLVSHLLVRGVAQAIGFYERDWGATELFRSRLPDALGIHGQLRVGNALLLLTDEDPDSGQNLPGFRSPQLLVGSSVSL